MDLQPRSSGPLRCIRQIVACELNSLADKPHCRLVTGPCLNCVAPCAVCEALIKPSLTCRRMGVTSPGPASGAFSCGSTEHRAKFAVHAQVSMLKKKLGGRAVQCCVSWLGARVGNCHPRTLFLATSPGC